MATPSKAPSDQNGSARRSFQRPPATPSKAPSDQNGRARPIFWDRKPPSQPSNYTTPVAGQKRALTGNVEDAGDLDDSHSVTPSKRQRIAHNISSSQSLQLGSSSVKLGRRELLPNSSGTRDGNAIHGSLGTPTPRGLPTTSLQATPIRQHQITDVDGLFNARPSYSSNPLSAGTTLNSQSSTLDKLIAHTATPITQEGAFWVYLQHKRWNEIYPCECAYELLAAHAPYFRGDLAIDQLETPVNPWTAYSPAKATATTPQGLISSPQSSDFMTAFTVYSAVSAQSTAAVTALFDVLPSKVRRLVYKQQGSDFSPHALFARVEGVLHRMAKREAAREEEEEEDEGTE